MKEALRELAKHLGFESCRVANATAAPHAAMYKAWIEEGCAGGMQWLARDPERRSDPRIVLPGAASVIVLAKNYFQGGSNPGPGRIARYAWGDDYHELIEARLREIDQFLAAHGGTQRVYVDTGPVLERDFAAEAGIGWHGKSTMLLNAELGTWFFLAVVLTTLEIEPDPPQPNRCGSCTRCIDSCPTNAITGPHRLDARRCISYLTIENKGPIPIEFRRLVGDRIYGCDECLEVCPWNRFAKAASEVAFAPRSYVTGWALRDYLKLDDETFRTVFRGSPIKRIKRRGLLRNVCVALGNVGTSVDLPALEKAAHDPEPLIAEHAQWAISEILRREQTSRLVSDPWPLW